MHLGIQGAQCSCRSSDKPESIDVEETIFFGYTKLCRSARFFCRVMAALRD